MTYRAHARTRRRSPSPCRSSGGVSIHRRPDARARDRDGRGRDLPPPRRARGFRRWVIRWAKPCRVGPYQAQRGAPVGAAIWLSPIRVRLSSLARCRAPTVSQIPRVGAVARGPYGKWRVVARDWALKRESECPIATDADNAVARCSSPRGRCSGWPSGPSGITPPSSKGWPARRAFPGR
jgi:hypothetical protein